MVLHTPANRTTDFAPLARFKINRPTDVRRGTTELPDNVLRETLSENPPKRNDGDMEKRCDANVRPSRIVQIFINNVREKGTVRGMRRRGGGRGGEREGERNVYVALSLKVHLRFVYAAWPDPAP